MAQELLAELGGATSPVEAAVIMLMERMDSVESSAERLERWRTSIQGAGPELAALLRPKASSVDAEDSAERARLYGALVALQVRPCPARPPARAASWRFAATIARSLASFHHSRKTQRLRFSSDGRCAGRGGSPKRCLLPTRR